MKIFLTIPKTCRSGLSLSLLLLVAILPLQSSHGAKKEPSKSLSPAAKGQDKLIVTGKMIARNQQLLAIKAKDGKIFKLPISALNKKQSSLKKGDTLTVEVDFESYQKLNKKK